jgi:LEA14-like dessication related protein
MKRRTLIPLLALVALAAGGCAGAFTQPEIRFDGVRVGSLGLRGGLLYAQLHVTNPNRFAFETASMSYDLELRAPASAGQEARWVRVAQGTYDERVRVEGRQGRLVEIPIEFTYAGLEGALRSVLDQGTVNYRVEGTVQVVDPLRRQVPYRRTGVVAVSGAR